VAVGLSGSHSCFKLPKPAVRFEAGDVMVHPASGFRGTRAGVTAGSGSSLQSTASSAQPLPRIRVSYWCAKGHETQPVFLKLPEEQIPVTWDCRRCGAPASRDGQAAALADPFDDG
jgi:rubredoxin